MKKFCKLMWLVLLASGLMAFVPSAAQADIIFTLGNDPQSDEQNILFNEGFGNGTNTVVGLTNQTDTEVSFHSTTNILTTPSQGQAEVDSADPIKNLSIFLTNGGSFKDFILNPECPPGSGGCGSATIAVVDNGNITTTFTYTLGNGQNFLAITAVNGQSIQSVTIDSITGTGFDDLNQPRISGVGALVPEPTTVLFLGCGLIGLWGARRKLNK